MDTPRFANSPGAHAARASRRLLPALLVALFGLHAPLAHADEPADAVNAFQTSLLESMKQARTLGCAGREKKLAPVIEARFDTATMAHYTLRRSWADLTDAQRSAFTETFNTLVVSTYASEFDGYNGETFTTLSTETSGDNRVVHVRFKPSDSGPIAFDYVLHTVDGQWKIINVIADGVSDLAVRSAQYQAAVKSKGIDALMDSLKAQIAKTEASCH